MAKWRFGEMTFRRNCVWPNKKKTMHASKESFSMTDGKTIYKIIQFGFSKKQRRGSRQGQRQKDRYREREKGRQIDVENEAKKRKEI